MTKDSPITPKRGEIYLVSLDPTIGSEINKTRPAVILQNDIDNRYSSVTIVAAISSKVERLYPTEILVKSGEGGLDKNSRVLLNQVRTIDKQRLVKKIGTLTRETMSHIDQSLKISLGLADI
ncbi:type II toxin-antitoxin system PemK/MazF family toxin [Patescibacteria group bacterium AH-259-L05]|nr:type II toxin-antitoxin system PemK/MazF family toxin [Patescibacteria group bacterium AH-259-L05]